MLLRRHGAAPLACYNTDRAKWKKQNPIWFKQ